MKLLHNIYFSLLDLFPKYQCFSLLANRVYGIKLNIFFIWAPQFYNFYHQFFIGSCTLRGRMS